MDFSLLDKVTSARKTWYTACCYFNRLQDADSLAEMNAACAALNEAEMGLQYDPYAAKNVQVFDEEMADAIENLYPGAN